MAQLPGLSTLLQLPCLLSLLSAPATSAAATLSDSQRRDRDRPLALSTSPQPVPSHICNWCSSKDQLISSKLILKKTSSGTETMVVENLQAAQFGSQHVGDEMKGWVARGGGYCHGRAAQQAGRKMGWIYNSHNPQDYKPVKPTKTQKTQSLI